MDCFHRVTLWSPVDTANTLPVMDQLTLQTGASNCFRSVGTQADFASCCFQMSTVRSSEPLAIILYGMAELGAHATSRTQSEAEKEYIRTQIRE
jgi:hypothetical protein